MSSQQTINVGTVPNDATGDPLQLAFTKCNTNFTALFNGLIASLNTPQTLTATNGQTVFNLATTTNVASILLVFLDGVFMYPTTDYTVAAGSPPTLTLVNGALSGQKLFVQ